jgi:fatty acid desaturase (delta-4 desaturase)
MDCSYLYIRESYDIIKYSMEVLDSNEIIIDGWVYDLHRFSKIHPGGKAVLNVFGGNDVSIHYYMLHNHQILREKALAPFKLRQAETNYSLFNLNTPAYKDLKARVKKAIPYPYATIEWYMKAIGIMLISIYIEYDNIKNGFTYLKSSVLGIAMAMIGLCIQHDANHGAISPNSWVNKAWGYTQDWIGGSSLLWNHHHVLMHHAETNVLDNDPDVTTEIIRLHKSTNIYGYHRFQDIYTWFLLPFLPISWHFKEIYDLIKMQHCNKNISKMASYDSTIALVFRTFFIIRFYTIPLYYYPSFHTIACIFNTLIIGGAYLGINFIISHNFEGVRPIMTQYNKDKKDWERQQVESSSTVGGRLLGYFHGGLNYQIEHHLFPRISHVHYHILKDVVQEWCSDYDIHYTYFDNIFDNIVSCYRHINRMGVEI